MLYHAPGNTAIKKKRFYIDKAIKKMEKQRQSYKQLVLFIYTYKFGSILW